MGALFACNVMPRMALGFANPNHAAAMICAMMPFCWAWRRCAWIGNILVGVLFVMLLLTQSRTGLLVAGAEVGREAMTEFGYPTRSSFVKAVSTEVYAHLPEQASELQT